MDATEAPGYRPPMRRILLVIAALPIAFACSKSSSEEAAPAPGASGASAPSAAAPAQGQGVVAALKSAVTSKPFEGEATLTMTDDMHPTPQTVVLMFKDQKIRYNIGTLIGPHATWGIMDLKDKKIVTVMDAQKKYMEMDLGAENPMMGHGMAPGAPAMTAPPTDSTPPKIEKTGKHETIAGHDCEDWNVTSPKDSHKGMLCMASDLGSFDFNSLGGASFASSFYHPSLFSEPVIPIKIIGYDATGKEKSHIEVTKIEKKPEDDSNFVPPAGYTKFDMGSLGGLGGGMPHMPPNMPNMPNMPKH
jgi:hypothetical protein